MSFNFGGKRARILDFDIECRPLSWYGGDFVTKEVTAIACQFVDQKRAYCWLLGKHTSEEILEGFREKYNAADIVTGHYIRGFDLPTINGAMIEFGLEPLTPKLSQCTKSDLQKWSGLSKSQENIGSMLGLENPKVGMNQAKWRSANRLEPKGIAHTRERVIGDVRQHIEMRSRMLELGLLSQPRVWTPSGAGGTRSYHP